MIIRGDVPAWLRPADRGSEWISEPGQQLSQYGDEVWGYREVPRERDRGTISMLLGRLSPTQAYRAMMGRPPKPDNGPKVRWFQVETLNVARYAAYRTPSHSNPSHASVLWVPPGVSRDSRLDHLATEWDTPDRTPLSEIAEEES